jgi:hypothetical protein
MHLRARRPIHLAVRSAIALILAAAAAVVLPATAAHAADGTGWSGNWQTISVCNPVKCTTELVPSPNI